ATARTKSCDARAKTERMTAIRGTRTLVLTAHALLLLLVFSWQVVTRRNAAGVVIGALFCIPLLLSTRGLWLAKRRTHAWATLCIIPYFVLGVTEAIANPQQRLWAAGCLALALTLFTALITSVNGK